MLKSAEASADCSFLRDVNKLNSTEMEATRMILSCR